VGTFPKLADFVGSPKASNIGSQGMDVIALSVYLSKACYFYHTFEERAVMDLTPIRFSL